MTRSATDTSIRASITVDAPLERAFKVFTEDFDRIKPREHNLLGVDIAETVFERREGGHVYMVIDGRRFDTTGRSETGSRWQASDRSSAGYVVRHPPGL